MATNEGLGKPLNLLGKVRNSGKCYFWKYASGTEGRNRTGTPVKEPDFESGASTSSATPARASAVYQKFLWRRV